MKRLSIIGIRISASILVFIFFIATAFAQANPSGFTVNKQGNGQPVILIPGLGCSADVWNSTIDSLKSHYTCYALNIDGFAGVPAVKGLTLKEISAGIASYIRSTIKEKVILIGHSMGGVISLMVASQHPELIKKVLVIDALPYLPAIRNPAATSKKIKSAALEMKAKVISQTKAQFKASTEKALSGMIAARSKIPTVLDWCISSNRNFYGEMTYELMITDMRKQIAKIKAPVLVLGSWAATKQYGLTEQILQSAYEQQYQNCKTVTVRMAPTAYHFIMIDQPKWYIHQVLLFLK
jgi:pimeloyl-ACP methyl ester carboxylesterase